MGIEPGLVGKKTITVTKRNTAPHVPVFSTPALVQLFEQACTAAIKKHLPTGSTHVGYEVNIRHLGPVPIGGQVAATAEITDVRGNKVYFKVAAHHRDGKISDGTYSCAIVPATFGKE